MDSYKNPKPGTTYFSPRLSDFQDPDRKVRIVSRANEQHNGYDYAREKGEVVIRLKEDAATCIKAKFFEVDREIFVLTIQKFRTDTGMPYGSGFSLVGPEITRLIEFLEQIKLFPIKADSAIRISNADLRRLSLSGAQAARLVTDNEDLFAEVVKSAITKQDVVSVAYRKRQLDVFERLLRDPDYFEQLKERKGCSNEALWQAFFESNPWVFGYGLGYIYLTGFTDKKLEQIVQGFQIGTRGKRSDALLKTRGAVSNLCFVEIKTHKTPLLNAKSYRAGCWAPSSELSGGVAQVQGSVSAAVDSLQRKLTLLDDQGFPTGEEAYNFSPRSFLVVGDLHEFVQDSGVSSEKLRSFELYRRHTSAPEILTFDELFERARFIVSSSEN